MINALIKNPQQFNSAWYYAGKDEEQGVFFEFSWEDGSKNKTRGTQGRNIVRDSIVTRIRTDYDIQFKIGGYVVLSDGNMYYIDSIIEEISTVAYQSLGTVCDPSKDSILTLSIVQNTKAGAP